MSPRGQPNGGQSRERNHNWKGGRTVASNGYVLVKAPWHPNADRRGYVYEHRLAAEWKLGRVLCPGEQVHHKNHDTRDNRPENLEVLTKAQHGVEHRKPGGKRLQLPGEPNDMVACACGCGSTFRRFDESGRLRRFVSGHNVQPKGAQRG